MEAPVCDGLEKYDLTNVQRPDGQEWNGEDDLGRFCCSATGF
jgi:hypothetical protein